MTPIQWLIVIYMYWTVCMFVYMINKPILTALLLAFSWPIVVGVAILNKLI